MVGVISTTFSSPAEAPRFSSSAEAPSIQPVDMKFFKSSKGTKDPQKHQTISIQMKIFKTRRGIKQVLAIVSRGWANAPI